MGTKYYFDSFGDSSTTQWLGSGTLETTGEKEDDYVAVKVLSNNTVQEFVGKTYWVDADAEADDNTGYQLYSQPKSSKGTGMYVKIYSTAPNRTVSFTIDDGTDPVQSATVTIGEISKTTGSAGGCSFTLLDGAYSVTVEKEGYTTETEDITVEYDEVTFTISITTA